MLFLLEVIKWNHLTKYTSIKPNTFKSPDNHLVALFVSMWSGILTFMKLFQLFNNNPLWIRIILSNSPQIRFLFRSHAAISNPASRMQIKIQNSELAFDSLEQGATYNKYELLPKTACFRSSWKIFFLTASFSLV